MLLGIRALPSRIMRGVRAQDMVKDDEVVVAYLLRSLCEVTHGFGISAYLRLWENNPELHCLAPSIATASAALSRSAPWTPLTCCVVSPGTGERCRQSSQTGKLRLASHRCSNTRFSDVASQRPMGDRARDCALAPG